ncbi:hypothetical protein CHR37_04310 [Bacillus velezensis]|uniref:Uncharacterized protein n=1 Tax=Bacillus amyloliquefaciens (strain Y2) TaxID=1155777 RepID=I2C5D8_BACAY|nr:hypothetical protein [Bacillus amyloliquefaciens]AFJ61862.1 hypothetical protein MUS_1867 [Bacillus velezensis YAU B9601-Y2]ASK58474.1 hypothetical protein CFN60_08775 [Bacillus velezensis]ATV22830.1 hypothetical protein CS547_08815 [Bacillus sp. Lzh-5]AUG35831.1 hypothetical protein CXP43_08855 [Bacillus velezensis]AWM44192.1 hypothetical protein BAALB65_09130 [Bacillus amyloliquefaciens]
MNILISLYITITNFKNRRLVLLVDLNSFLSLPENPWKNVVSSGKVVTVGWAAAAVCPDLLNGNGDNGSYI